MIIGLTGFHNSGKSYLCQYLEQRFAWKWLPKRSLLREWSGLLEDEPAWTEWYRNLYRTMDGYKVVQELLKRIAYHPTRDTVILFDAVHQPAEWRAIKEADPTCILVAVFTPADSRLARGSNKEIILDALRERYWHDEANKECLPSQIEWAFCGLASPQMRSLETEAFHDYLLRTNKIHL